MSKRPNIIIFNPDQMRADAMRHLGNEAAYTPNLDKLAAEGVSFSNAFCQNTVCVPSRCSFMTGLYPHVFGHRTMNHLLHNHEDNLFLDMKAQGYHTISSTRGDLLNGEDEAYNNRCVDEWIKTYPRQGAISRWYEGNRGASDSDTFFSFMNGIIPTETSSDVAVNGDDLIIDGAIRSIKSRSEEPFFMFLGFLNPHPPYQIEKKYYDLIDETKLKKRYPSIESDDLKPSMEIGLADSLRVSNWSEERLDEIRKVYLAMCAKIDDELGQLIAVLKEEGIYDDTVILFFSDHGDYTTDFGIVEKSQNCFPDCLCNIPLIVKPSKDIKVESGINKNLVELTDICATAADFAGFELNREQFGTSLIPMLKDKTLSKNEYVFCEGGRLEMEEQASEYDEKIFSEDSPYGPRWSLQRKIPEHTKATMIRSDRYKYVKRLYELDEFYDLSIGEGKNLIHDKKYAQIILEMKDKMLEWYQSTCDIVPKNIDTRFAKELFFNTMRASGMPEEKIEEFNRSLENGNVKIKDMLSRMFKNN